jgi:hypothetical protein
MACEVAGVDLRLAYPQTKKPHSMGAVRPQSEMRLEGEAVTPDKQLIFARRQ